MTSAFARPTDPCAARGEEGGTIGGEKLELLISRFDPARDAALREQRYEVGVRPDGSVLDALNHLKDEIDPTLSFRWSCRMEICGSCGMMIDGEPRLACSTFLRDFRSPLRIGPLAHFAATPVGRLALAVAIVLPLWNGAFHLRHTAMDLLGTRCDRFVGPASYALATAGSLAAVVALSRL